jgi:WD40 repeat protein
MTPLRLAILALAAALLLVACGGDDKQPSTPPIAEVTAAPPPSATATPAAPAGGTFTAGPTARLAELQGLVWQREGAGLLAYNRTEVQLIDASGAARSVLKTAPGESVVAVADTGFVATQADRAITIRNVRVSTAATKRLAPTDQFSTAVISPDGSLVALTLADRIAVQLWDVEEQRLLKEFTGFQTAAPVYGVRFSPDGRALVWGSRAKVQLMDLASGSFSTAVEHEDFVGSLALTTDRLTLITAAGPKLTVWDVASGKQKLSEDQPSTIRGLALSPDNRTIAVATSQNVRLLDVTSARETGTVAAPNARTLAFSQEGKQLAVSDETGLITLWRRP